MQKKEGFKGQRSVVLPDFIIRELKDDPVCSQLYFTDIGYYPSALYHGRIREKGCNQLILIYCIRGEGWFSVMGRKRKVVANQFFIIPKNTSHAYGSSEDNPWSIYWVHFSGQQASHFYDPEGNTGTISPSKIARIEERLQLFEEIIQNMEMGYSKENLEYANICLWHFLASFKYISQFRQIQTLRERDPVEYTIFYMRENLHKKLTLENLAGEAGFSPSHFSLLFRKKTGRSPMDYLIYLRIQRACQYLDNTGYRVQEIARKVGYEDPYYFSRLLKKVMGNSPSEYRKKEKG
ncbi:MAG: AraC family transcriptional regulator [Bacteroidota bacterium]